MDYSEVTTFMGNLKGNHSQGSVALSPTEIDQYWTRGYIGPVPLLSAEDCDLLLNELQTFQNGDHPRHDLFYEFHRNQSNDPSNVLMHCLGHWRITPGFHDLIYLPRLVEMASHLLKPNETTPVRFWHDQLFCKPPRFGGVVAWHQDYSYWTRTIPMNHLTIHVALDDQDVENGGLHYIPFSHTWTRQDDAPLPITDANFKDMESIKSILTKDELDQFEPHAMQLKRGECVFHHPLVVHGSFANQSDRPRRAAVINYFGDGTISNTDQPLMEGIPVISKGQYLKGKFFPLLGKGQN